MNHEGFERREEVVMGILQAHNLQATSVKPIDYDEPCPFPYNNFIYKIELDRPIAPDVLAGSQENLCSALPPETPAISTLILRLSNPRADGLNNVNRVQNEVASLLLTRSALKEMYPDVAALIPAVYAWQAGKERAEAEKDFGWVMMECRPGVSLDAHLGSLTPDGRKVVIDQIAHILAALQSIKLPHGVTAHGGLTVDAAGNIGQLAAADTSPVLRGWRQDGLRTRIDRFLDEAFGAVLSGCSIDLDRLAFIHGDLTSSNILFDPETNRLTALLDFDFAFVSHPAHEFFVPLSDVGGNTSVSDSRITAAMLSGNFDVKLGTELASGDKDADNTARLLSRAQTWDAALRAAGGMRPSEIAGVVTLDKLRQLEGLLCPFQLVHPVIVKRKTPEELEQGWEKVAESLARALENFGF